MQLSKIATRHGDTLQSLLWVWREWKRNESLVNLVFRVKLWVSLQYPGKMRSECGAALHVKHLHHQRAGLNQQNGLGSVCLTNNAPSTSFSSFHKFKECTPVHYVGMMLLAWPGRRLVFRVSSSERLLRSHPGPYPHPIGMIFSFIFYA